ncbi:MAG: ABC transporter ATP-binding protein [Acidimicrobiaceae bacterium]|nr:ABC transporter ATP-binding protein [Acidimicrobiaceae bacterium]
MMEMSVVSEGVREAEVSAPILELRGVSRQFGGVHAVEDISMSVYEGQVVGLIGPNGAGKSTIVSLIAGSLQSTDGKIFLDQKELSGLAPDVIARRGIARTFQVSAEFSRLTVLQNLLVAPKEQKGEGLFGALAGRRYWGGSESQNIERAFELLTQFGMLAKANDYAGSMSGGQRRLLEVMRAIMVGPRVLLLDEPTAGVHPNMIGELREQLVRLRNQGLTILMVEHEMDFVRSMCDVVIVMARGRVIAKGTLDEVRSDPKVMEAYVAG